MQLSCPKCESRDIRVSTRQGIGEAIKALCGIYQLRCRHCATRWETSMWAGGAWKYAHCPRCYRQELTTWSLQYYHPPLGTYLKIQAGATPYRCVACRCNFASFRPLRQKFVWRHRTHAEPAAVSRPLHPADLQALAGAVNESTVRPAAEPQPELSKPLR